MEIRVNSFQEYQLTRSGLHYDAYVKDAPFSDVLLLATCDSPFCYSLNLT